MSRENVELFCRSVDAFNRRDRDAYLSLMDAELEAQSRLAAMEGGYHGHEGVRRWWDDFTSVFPDYVIELEELRDLGDVTLGRFRARGHGAASDTPVVDPAWLASEWRNGKCVWWRVCPTEAEALEAVERREGDPYDCTCRGGLGRPSKNQAARPALQVLALRCDVCRAHTTVTALEH